MNNWLIGFEAIIVLALIFIGISLYFEEANKKDTQKDLENSNNTSQDTTTQEPIIDIIQPQYGPVQGFILIDKVEYPIYLSSKGKKIIYRTSVNGNIYKQYLLKTDEKYIYQK